MVCSSSGSIERAKAGVIDLRVVFEGATRSSGGFLGIGFRRQDPALATQVVLEVDIVLVAETSNEAVKSVTSAWVAERRPAATAQNATDKLRTEKIMGVPP
jgi:hypothetical protein